MTNYEKFSQWLRQVVRKETHKSHLSMRRRYCKAGRGRSYIRPKNPCRKQLFYTLRTEQTQPR